MPARTKAASWREKFMISTRFTFFVADLDLPEARPLLDADPEEPLFREGDARVVDVVGLDHTVDRCPLGGYSCVLELGHRPSPLLAATADTRCGGFPESS